MRQIERIHLSSPDITDTERTAVVAAMNSGWIAPLGPDVDAFEAEISNRVGTKYAVALSSGTAALHLGLLSLGVKPGQVVITATMTFAATANAIVYTGAEPFFVDCEESTGNIDPALLEASIKELRARGKDIACIVPVDLLGKAANYTKIESIAQDHEIPVLVDAAESLGASHAEKPVGSFGDATIFSFNGNKIMTTSGGGMLVTDRRDVASRTRYLATQARQPVPHYEHTDIGFNYRLSNLLAALGRAQLSRLDEMIARRRILRQKYKEFFESIPGIAVFGCENDREDNAWLTAIGIDTEATDLCLSDLSLMLSEANVESRPIWKPMHLQPIFAQYDGKISGASEKLFKTHITLPSGSALTGRQHDRIFGLLAEVIN